MPWQPSWSGTETAQPSANAAAISRNSACVNAPIAPAPRRSAYDGKHCDATASIAHCYDSTGHIACGSRCSGSKTVVTATSGSSCRFVLR